MTQLARTEALHDQIEAEIDYPVEFISYRITGYRSETEYAALLSGKDILPDLRLIIDELSWSAEEPLADAEPCESADDLATRLNVSTKTLSRWRKLGLRWRWLMLAPGAAKELVYPRSAVQRFLAQHPDVVDRAAGFTQMSHADRRTVVTQARQLAQAGDATFNQIAQTLAEQTGRAVETIRQLLERHDRQSPDEAVFPERAGPIRGDQQQQIVETYCSGESVAAMARKFSRTRATVYRIINEARTLELQGINLTAVTSPTFDRDDAASVILRQDTEHAAASVAPHDDELPEPIATYAAQVISPPRRVASMIVRMNYLKYRAARTLAALDGYHPAAGQLDSVESDLSHAYDLWRELTVMHRPALVAAARHHNLSESDRTARRVQVLIEIGQPILIEAVRVFDAGRNMTFDAYLRWTLMRRFAATTETSRAYRRVLPSEWLAELDAALPTMPMLISRRRKDHAPKRKRSPRQSPDKRT